MAEWDIAGENGGSQESFKRSNDFDEAFIYFSRAFTLSEIRQNCIILT